LVVPGLSQDQSNQLISLLNHIQLSKAPSSNPQASEHTAKPVYANFAGNILYDYSPNVCLSSIS